MFANRRLLNLFFLGMLSTGLVVSCHHKTKPTPVNPEIPKDDIYNPYKVHLDPVYEIRSTQIHIQALPENVTVSTIPAQNIYLNKTTGVKRTPEINLPGSKFSPILQKWLDTLGGDEIVRIIITFKADMHIPRLPDLGDHERRGSGHTQRDAAIAELIQQRNSRQADLRQKLEQFGQFEYLENFWIVNSFVARVPIDQVKALSRADFVVYMEPAVGGEPPPADANPGNDVADGRAKIVSDPYFNLDLTHPWIGLIDTGVRDSHELFNDPRTIDWMRDCVKGGVHCNDTTAPDYDPLDIPPGHGTSSAGILTANLRMGDDFRGVTEIRVDSWKVYEILPPPNNIGASSESVIRAIQTGVASFDRVLVGELQIETTEVGAVAQASDDAYDAGAIVVAANGNYGPNPMTVKSPANAHKVIGTGAFSINGGAQYVEQSRGPTITDGRIKPDIQAPNRTETAGAANDTALTVFGGTSGATPYAASAAMLSTNWLRRYGSFDNGQTYAFMILYGQNPFPYDNNQGAGPLEMATDGWAWWGKAVLSHQLNVDIPINVPQGKKNLDVALWWPESLDQIHNDIDVFLLAPDGQVHASGTDVLSVFERTGVSGQLAQGTWTVRIRGENVPGPNQLVYWAVTIRN